MANQLTHNPFSIDTPSAAVLYIGDMSVCHMEYVGATDPTHVVDVHNRFGILIAKLGGSVSAVYVTEEIHNVHGILVPVLNSDGNPNLPSGKLLVYFR